MVIFDRKILVVAHANRSRVQSRRSLRAKADDPQKGSKQTIQGQSRRSMGQSRRSEPKQTILVKASI